MSQTKLVYLEDAYKQSCSAKVTSVKQNGQVIVILDQTIFYPQGGGQPSDQGEIIGKSGSFRVTHVQYRDGVVEHAGKLTGSILKGDEVTIQLDWPRRYQHMQIHTAGHLIDEAVKQTLPEFHGIDGMHGIGNKQYIAYPGFIDQAHQQTIEAKIQDLINQNLPITSRMVTLEIIQAENIVIPFELPKNKPLRLIQFGTLPPVPDGGTQLSSTGMCWPTSISEFEYKDSQTIIHYQVHKPETVQHSPINGQVSISDFTAQLNHLLAAVNQTEKTEANRALILGKKGKFNQIATILRDLPAVDRQSAGQLLNHVKQQITANFNQLSSQPINQSTEFLDLTIPGILPPIGHLHLISEAISDIEAIFCELGFVRRRYPEIETDWYYAEGLNIPKDHPARDDQETFYFSDNVVLTAHTSIGQLREMELMKTPPIKMINIGKTYRRQASNTHSPMFHQFEGLLIDKNINLTHLVGVSNYFAKKYFGPTREIRLRPHHFQFTEPSFEVDINCHMCAGKGEIGRQPCKVCKSGWLELGGAGMVHPNVLKNGGIDPNLYSGFAFGWGVERVIMMKHQVTDNLRQLYTDDLRFLQQS